MKRTSGSWLLLLRNSGFYFFWKQKHSLAPQIILSNHSFCFRSSARQSCCLLFSYHLIRLMWSLGWEQRGKFTLLILLSKTRSKQKRVIQSDQEVQMCGILLVDSGWTPLYDLSLLVSFYWMSAIYFSLLFYFFQHVLWTCGIPSLGMHLLFHFV